MAKLLDTQVSGLPYTSAPAELDFCQDCALHKAVSIPKGKPARSRAHTTCITGPCNRTPHREGYQNERDHRDSQRRNPQSDREKNQSPNCRESRRESDQSRCQTATVTSRQEPCGRWRGWLKGQLVSEYRGTPKKTPQTIREQQRAMAYGHRVVGQVCNCAGHVHVPVRQDEGTQSASGEDRQLT
eukprot:scaffold471263_cov13-Prasinocladus_malaysianus.AAC.1